MAKHLGTRSRSRLRPWSSAKAHRGVVAGVGGVLGMATVTAVLVAQAMNAGGADDLGVAAAQHGVDSGAGSGTKGGSDGSGRTAHRGALRVDVSRQAIRPKRTPYRVQHGTTLALRRAVVLARKVDALSPAQSSFTIGQSNVLGSQHTAGSGGYGPGSYRAGITASLLTSHGVDVGGMQEVQSDQLGVFLNRMPAYSFWPAGSLGHNGERLQIYWRTDRFTMEESGSVPYVFSSQRIPLPYVLLRDNSSGAEFWVITAHNSAGGMELQRDAATGTEISLINRLRATGVPVIITGDMNEHTEFFCRVSAATGMVAANGGSGSGGCHLPPPPLRVDWIMGGGGVTFSGYYQSAAGLHRASDHYYLYSQVTATSRWFAAGSTP
jgi:hypothetical protein